MQELNLRWGCLWVQLILIMEKPGILVHLIVGIPLKQLKIYVQ